jgi:hypothetical protein
MLDQESFANQHWVKWRVKDGHKGPMIWEVKHLMFYPVDEDGLPGERMHLVVARDVLNPEVVKFFVSNAPAGTSIQVLLLVAFSRWRVERCFEDQKGEIGLDQYEGRRYQGLKRHLILSCVSYLFLSRIRQEFGGKNQGADGVPSAQRSGSIDPILVVETVSTQGALGADKLRDRASAATKRPGEEMPRQADAKATPRPGNQTHRCAPLQVGHDLAL